MGYNISIHALREEGDGFLLPSFFHSNVISIHALREEGDRYIQHRYKRDHPFLSTPSARRATKMRKQYVWTKDISIHALREEGDSKQ